jgi:hypothetical protein
VEKVQVTFAVRASVTRAPVGTPILLATYRHTGALHEVVVYVERDFLLEERETFEANWGPVAAYDASLISAEVGDAIYQWVVANIGIQGQLESLP